MDEISQMMSNLSSRSIQDIVCHYLLAQPPVAALGYVNTWFSHWRRQILYHRDFSKKINMRKKENKKDKIRFLNKKNISSLEKLYISSSEFSEGDKSSMLACFSRYEILIENILLVFRCNSISRFCYVRGLVSHQCVIFN